MEAKDEDDKIHSTDQQMEKTAAEERFARARIGKEFTASSLEALSVVRSSLVT